MKTLQNFQKVGVPSFGILDVMVGIDFISKTPIGTKKKSTEKRKTDFEEEKSSSKQKEIHRQTTVNVSENQIKSGLDHKKDNNALEINRNQEKGMSNFRYAYGIDSNSEIHEEDIKIVGDTSQEPILNSKPRQKQKSFVFSEEKETSKTPAGFSEDFVAEYNKYADNVTVSDTFLKPPKENISQEKIEIDGKIKENTMSNNIQNQQSTLTKYNEIIVPQNVLEEIKSLPFHVEGITSNKLNSSIKVRGSN